MYTLVDSSLFEKYAISFYWAVITTTQVGYGDIVAHTNLEVSLYIIMCYAFIKGWKNCVINCMHSN